MSYLEAAKPLSNPEQVFQEVMGLSIWQAADLMSFLKAHNGSYEGRVSQEFGAGVQVCYFFVRNIETKKEAYLHSWEEIQAWMLSQDTPLAQAPSIGRRL